MATNLLASSHMVLPKLLECKCENIQTMLPLPQPRPFTAAIKICECACNCDCECCIERFYSGLEDEPDWLQKLDKIQFTRTPLHEAAEEGKTALAVEIMNLMPSLGTKLDTRGLSPLHTAVVNGRVDTALALAKFDKNLVRVKGKGGLTPLHYAAAAAPLGDKEELRVLAGFLVECPEAIAVLNNRKQSAVHVAVESKNEEAVKLLVNWLVIMAKESVLSIRDAQGNTVLHVAARHNHSRELFRSLIKLVKINKANNYGETPLDIAIFHRNHEAVDMLKYAGARIQTPREGDNMIPQEKPSTMVKYLRTTNADRCAEFLTRTYFFLIKELTMDLRNTILVVAVLITTATYQGVLQPPGGVYSAEGTNNTTVGTLGRMRRLEQDHPPGKMVMGTIKYSYFMPTNTLAFISSTLIIIFVLPDRAFIMILQACLIFMCVSYLLALNFISDYNKFSKILDIVCGCTLSIAFSMKLAYYFVKAYYNQDEWLMRRLGVMINNKKAYFIRRGAKKQENGEISVLRRMRQQYKMISKRDDL